MDHLRHANQVPTPEGRSLRLALRQYSPLNLLVNVNEKSQRDTIILWENYLLKGLYVGLKRPFYVRNCHLQSPYEA